MSSRSHVMQSFVSVMTSLRSALVAAIKSLMRGRSIIQAILAFWISPNTARKQDTNARVPVRRQTIEEFLEEAEQLLLGPISGDKLRIFSDDLKQQFRERLHTHPECMLPSYNHLLPSGNEEGRFLALDVGGSTLRVALVELRTREAVGRESEIVHMSVFKISEAVKQYEGMAFFDWMAQRICEVMRKDGSEHRDSEKPIPLGLAWSFPVEQTSLGGGLLLPMGKGFLATNGLLGQDLGKIIQVACREQGLNVELSAIVNDGSATLLSQAYIHGTTRFGLILGTGTNIAVHLPVAAFGRTKFGKRPESWFDMATHVIVNTELGMFGKNILPLTQWDELLNAAHPRPDFQPLEHLLSGYYLGEVCRHALVEAIETTGILGGIVPRSLAEKNSLDTETLSRIEADSSPTLETAQSVFNSRHPDAKATIADLLVIRSLASFVTRRSSALLAASVFSLWELRHETEAEYLATHPTKATKPVIEAAIEHTLPRTMVAYNGSVIEHYPEYRSNCQRFLDELVSKSDFIGSVDLVPALESSILGAAVALACAEEEKA